MAPLAKNVPDPCIRALTDLIAIMFWSKRWTWQLGWRFAINAMIWIPKQQLHSCVYATVESIVSHLADFTISVRFIVLTIVIACEKNDE